MKAVLFIASIILCVPISAYAEKKENVVTLAAQGFEIKATFPVGALVFMQKDNRVFMCNAPTPPQMVLEAATSISADLFSCKEIK